MMRCDEFVHESQAYSKAATVQRQSSHLLHEQIKDMRQRMRGDADAVVRNHNPDFIRRRLDTHVDMTTRRRVLGGVVEQIAEDLL